MMVRMVWGLAALWVVGCAHDRPMSQLQWLVGEDVVVHTTSSERPVDAVVEQSPGGPAFRTPSGEVIAPETISEVDVVHRGRGALQGLGIGTAIGLPVGAAIGYATYTDCSGQSNCLKLFSHGEVTAFASVLCGAVGAALGTLVGVGHGSSDVYSYRNEPRITPVGPPGSVGGVSITW